MNDREVAEGIAAIFGKVYVGDGNIWDKVLTDCINTIEYRLKAVRKDEREKHVAALRRAIEAFDRCDSNRGAFSCNEPHDCRCPKSRDIGECECGRDELDAALAACRKVVGE